MDTDEHDGNNTNTDALSPEQDDDASSSRVVVANSSNNSGTVTTNNRILLQQEYLPVPSHNTLPTARRSFTNSQYNNPIQGPYSFLTQSQGTPPIPRFLFNSPNTADATTPADSTTATTNTVNKDSSTSTTVGTLTSSQGTSNRRSSSSSSTSSTRVGNSTTARTASASTNRQGTSSSATTSNQEGSSNQQCSTSGSSSSSARQMRKRATIPSDKPVTTSRNKKAKRVLIKKNTRVCIKRSALMQICSDQEQRNNINTEYPNSALFYGTVVGGRSNVGWDVKFDDFPLTNNVIKKISRSRLTIVKPGTEERRFDEKYIMLMEEEDNDNTKQKKKSLEIQSEETFCKQSDEELKSAQTYECNYDKDERTIIWRIRNDGDHITDDIDFEQYKQNIHSKPVINEKIDFVNKSIHDNFFDVVWPPLDGCAKRIDKYLSDTRASYYRTCKNEKIKFDGDNDHQLKQCILLVIAAGTETEVGMNLWKAGSSGGRRNYPDFGQYIPANVMRAFLSAFPYMWSEEKYWFVDKRDVPWDMFLPTIDKWNDTQQQAFGDFWAIILDESMVGWRPKTTKLGGLPNYTWEPRKPIQLGTMLRNAAECIVGGIINNDPSMVRELQTQKEYGEMTSLVGTRSMPIPAHTAEVLRQVKNSGLKRGGWVGGDAWFGSIQTAVNTKLVHGVHSTFVIKNNSTLFPMNPLKAVLKARYGSNATGKWVVFQSTISGVKLIAIAYAWSAKGTSFFISTMGNTNPSKTLYRLQFEDDFGGTSFKDIPRPEIADFVYDFLPIIDEHNRQRQRLLNLEYQWPTKDCWTRLGVSLIGFSVVNLYRLYRNHDYEKYAGYGILKFSDMICGGLLERKRTIQSTPRALNQHLDLHTNLVRIRNVDGSTTKRITNHKTRTGAIGSAVQKSCWICRQYPHPTKEGQKLYKMTSFECTKCGTPLCKEPREGRPYTSCFHEHNNSTDNSVRCDGRKKNKFKRKRQAPLEAEAREDERRDNVEAI